MCATTPSVDLRPYKLEHEGLVESFWKPSKSGPDRKYYQLTLEGSRALEVEKDEWRTVQRMFSELWDERPALN